MNSILEWNPCPKLTTGARGSSAVDMTVNTPIKHYGDVIMGAIASQITSLTIVYPTVYQDADQRKHQSSASLAFLRGIHRGPVNSPHKWPVTRKMFQFDDVIMEREMFNFLNLHFLLKIPQTSKFSQTNVTVITRQQRNEKCPAMGGNVSVKLNHTYPLNDDYDDEDDNHDADDYNNDNDNNGDDSYNLICMTNNFQLENMLKHKQKDYSSCVVSLIPSPWKPLWKVGAREREDHLKWGRRHWHEDHFWAKSYYVKTR